VAATFRANARGANRPPPSAPAPARPQTPSSWPWPSRTRCSATR
jgi:hypothetical protein